ncbi:MAG: hypothetical protein J3R72DRAFT_150581 [Linnemannia gamsii]|nr:MAG: hypothetical protein J3R72DRAFT_150581 [Linnemannia gamsii]
MYIAPIDSLRSLSFLFLVVAAWMDNGVCAHLLAKKRRQMDFISVYIAHLLKHKKDLMSNSYTFSNIVTMPIRVPLSGLEALGWSRQSREAGSSKTTTTL